MPKHVNRHVVSQPLHGPVQRTLTFTNANVRTSSRLVAILVARTVVVHLLSAVLRLTPHAVLLLMLVVTTLVLQLLAVHLLKLLAVLPLSVLLSAAARLLPTAVLLLPLSVVHLLPLTAVLLLNAVHLPNLHAVHLQTAVLLLMLLAVHLLNAVHQLLLNVVLLLTLVATAVVQLAARAKKVADFSVNCSARNSAALAAAILVATLAVKPNVAMLILAKLPSLSTNRKLPVTLKIVKMPSTNWVTTTTVVAIQKSSVPWFTL